MKKIWTITAKDVTATFTDRNLLLTMFAAPVVLATIIAMVFGSDGDASFRDIPVALVKQDQGEYGRSVLEVFTGTETREALSLADTTVLSDPDLARQGVDEGSYAAAVIIPPSFSRGIAISRGEAGELSPIEVYGDAGRSISAGIIRSRDRETSEAAAVGKLARCGVFHQRRCADNR